jgi:hypothetical protein
LYILALGALSNWGKIIQAFKLMRTKKWLYVYILLTLILLERY